MFVRIIATTFSSTFTTTFATTAVAEFNSTAFATLSTTAFATTVATAFATTSFPWPVNVSPLFHLPSPRLFLVLPVFSSHHSLDSYSLSSAPPPVPSLPPSAHGSGTGQHWGQWWGMILRLYCSTSLLARFVPPARSTPALPCIPAHSIPSPFHPPAHSTPAHALALLTAATWTTPSLQPGGCNLSATGSQDATYRVWDRRCPDSSLFTLKGRLGAIRFMALVEPAGFVHVFDTRSGFTRAQEIGILGEITSISFSPDIEALFIGVADRTYSSLLDYTLAHSYDYLNACM
ncbi:unnamed protein product [Closterium sp. Naga37s-1]|nr:unnamed protein product [Closterium sp. Naga37s-1]